MLDKQEAVHSTSILYIYSSLECMHLCIQPYVVMWLFSSNLTLHAMSNIFYLHAHNLIHLRAQDEFAALAQGRLQRMKSREEPEGNQNAEPEPEEDLDDDPVPGPQKKLPRVTNKPGMMQTLDEAGEIVQDIYNFMLEELMDIVATDPHGAEKKLSTKLGQYAGSNQVVQNILALSNFKNGAFEGPVSWSSFGKQIREANETINSLKTEVRRLPNARGAGRPFGTKNRKRACDATTAKASKKQRTKAEEKGKGDEDEEAEPMDPDEPNEDASSNKTVNKSQSINLHTKCMIVEYALDAQEKGEVASVEKRVMEKFKKYFYSVEKNRFKTGLLSKWVECPGLTEHLLLPVPCRDF